MNLSRFIGLGATEPTGNSLELGQRMAVAARKNRHYKPKVYQDAAGIRLDLADRLALVFVADGLGSEKNSEYDSAAVGKACLEIEARFYKPEHAFLIKNQLGTRTAGTNRMTTLSLAWARPSETDTSATDLVIYHIGDSRIYVIEPDFSDFIHITTDQTCANLGDRASTELNKEIAEADLDWVPDPVAFQNTIDYVQNPFSNVLWSTLGSHIVDKDDPQVTILSNLKPGTNVLAATDGLCLDYDKILKIGKSEGLDPSRLIAVARSQLGVFSSNDDVSVATMVLGPDLWQSS